MKNRSKRKRKILSCLIAVLLLAESTATAAMAVGEEVANLLAEEEDASSANGTTSSTNTQSVVPDAGAEDWYIPTASTNPNQVDMDVKTFLVYNDDIYQKIGDIRYEPQYLWNTYYSNGGIKYTSYGHVTASMGQFAFFESWRTGEKAPIWYNFNYFTGAVSRDNGEPGIYKNLLTPEFILGGPQWQGPYKLRVDLTDFQKFATYLKHSQLSLRFGCYASGSRADIMLDRLEYDTKDDLTYDVPAGRYTVDIPYNQIGTEGNEKNFLTVRVLGSETVTDMHAVYIDNTSPSITGINANQNGEQLEVCIEFNEPMRWIDPSAEQDLNDIWVDVELQVLGTNVTHTVRAHVASVGSGRAYNQVYFRGDLGPFADLDYKVVAIKDVNLPIKDYAFTYGTLLMCGVQLKSDRVRSVAGPTKYVDGKVIPVTTKTTAICDSAGNALPLEAAVNWPINQREIKNGKTFVRRIELISDKTLLGKDMSQADSFNNSVSRADYFFGPFDEITPRLYLSQVLTEEELETFRIRLNMQDENGDYIWLTPKSTGRYYMQGEILCESDEDHFEEEFMYIDFEPLVLNQNMTPVMEDGSEIAYLTVDEVECTMVTSPALVDNIPGPEMTLYVDLLPPVITATAPASERPTPVNGYYPLDIRVDVTDATINGKNFSGILEQVANVYIGANVNEETSIRYLVNTEAFPPADVNGYTGKGTLKPNGKTWLTEKNAVGMTSETSSLYVHLLIPVKDNLLLDGVQVYVDVSDVVKNYTDENTGYDIPYHIDRQSPQVSITGSKVTYDSDSAIAEVYVSASDYNHVESIRYQWVKNGEQPLDDAWQAAPFTSNNEVAVTISSEYSSTDTAEYDMKLFVKGIDDRGNESTVKEHAIKININKPATVYEAGSDLSIPSVKPVVTVKGPAASMNGQDGYTRVTVAPLNPSAEWMYMTVVKTGSTLDVFSLDNSHGAEWYKVSMSGDFITAADIVDGTNVTLDDLKNYYGNVKISFESAYMDLTPYVGYKNDGVTDGSYIADQNILTARFASQNPDISDVNSISFGRVVDREGNQLATSGGADTDTIGFVSAERGVNTMRGLTLYFDVTNRKMSDWGVLDIDFENSFIELLQTRTESVEDAEVIWTQKGLSHSTAQSFTMPAYLEDDAWFTTGMYFIRVTVRSHSGSEDTLESMHFVLDTGEVTDDGLVSYSHFLPFDPEGSPYRGYSVETGTLDSFGIALQPTIEASRSNVFAVYTSGVKAFNFTISAKSEILNLDGITVGEIEGFRFWNSLSAPTAEDLAALPFATTNPEGSRASLSVTEGVETIYTKDTIPQGADGKIYLVEGVNTICYQTKMASGYVTPVKQFTIIVTQYIPEFNVAVHDYTPSHTYAQRDGQVNAHDITMIVEEAFSLNGSGNVRVELWSNKELMVNGTLVPETEENELNLSLTLLTDKLQPDDLVVLDQDSYTSCYPPYLGQGNYCTSAFVAVDEYGGSVVYAPQIGALDRVNDPEDAYDDNYSISYYGSVQDDPFVPGHDASFITIYNEEVYYGNELIGFQNLTSRNWGPYEPVEFSIPELKYNLFAISSNHVDFGGSSQVAYSDNAAVGLSWNQMSNYDLIDWDNTTITVYEISEVYNEVDEIYEETGEPKLLVSNLPLFSPGANAAGFIGARYGEVYFPDDGTREVQFAVYFANPAATTDHPAYDPDVVKGTAEDLASRRRIRFVIQGVNIYGDPFEDGGTVYTKYIDYEKDENGNTKIREALTGKGVKLTLPYVTVDYGQSILTDTFVNGTYTTSVTDMFGTSRTVTHEIKNGIASDVQIQFSTIQPTADAVKITLTSETIEKIYVDITDPTHMKVEGDGTNSVTISVIDNVRFSFQYMKDQDLKTVMLEVDHIVKPSPHVHSSNEETNYLVDADTGASYLYGTVTVELVDDNFELIDRYTGKAPAYTFVPGGPTSYTFLKDDILATFTEADGETRTVTALEQDVTFTLGVDELRAPIDPLEQLKNDSATGLKIKAYKESNGVYEDIQSSLIIESALMSDQITTAEGETRYGFTGYSISAASLLQDLGWGTGFRFVTEYTANAHAKSFIKKGIYPGAPDYQTGTSDVIEGVTLNGRLLTVTKNAQFTLYMVAADGGYVAVAFDVDRIGSAPVPQVVKVPVSNSLVRAYVVFPEDEAMTELTITSADTSYEVKTDAEGEFAGVPYVEYNQNDTFLLNYSFLYYGTPIEDSATATICEIKVRELDRVGEIVWSANKALDATDTTVSASLNFDEILTGFEVVEGELDSNALTIAISGKQAKFDYADNHGPITVRFDSAYGSVTVDIEAVTNMDQTAPIITEVSRTLSTDGRTLTVVLAASERTVLREGGYIGEQYEGDSLYYFTRALTENGSVTYHFIDMAGNETEHVVEVTEIVDEPLQLFFSPTGTMDDAVTDPSVLELAAGDTIYLTSSRDVTVSVNGGDGETLVCGDWLEIVLTDDLGGEAPYVSAIDAYSNCVIAQFSQIIPKDATAPTIVVAKSVVTVVVESNRAEVEALLLQNIRATDEDPNLTYEVTFTDDLTVSGSYVVDYKVTDTAGNEGTAQCRLLLVSGSEPWITINETHIDRDGSYFATPDEHMTLTVDVDGQPYCVYMESGIKTVAQMKIQHTDLTDYYITDTEVEIGTLESGFYTVVIQTQSRDYFRIIIYVY